MGLTRRDQTSAVLQLPLFVSLLRAIVARGSMTTMPPAPTPHDRNRDSASSCTRRRACSYGESDAHTAAAAASASVWAAVAPASTRALQLRPHPRSVDTTDAETEVSLPPRLLPRRGSTLPWSEALRAGSGSGSCRRPGLVLVLLSTLLAVCTAATLVAAAAAVTSASPSASPLSSLSTTAAATSDAYARALSLSRPAAARTGLRLSRSASDAAAAASVSGTVIPTSVLALQKPRTLRLGFLGSTNLPNSNTQTGGAPALFAARLAVAHLNAQSLLLPNVSLELVANNTDSDPGTGNFMAFDQVLNRGVVGIVGEYNSGVSVTASYPSRFFRVPQVSYGSTSPDFTVRLLTLPISGRGGRVRAATPSRPQSRFSSAPAHAPSPLRS